MSDLQIGLVVLGALVLVGLAVHGAWTARRGAPRRPGPVPSAVQAAPSGSAAAATDGARIEPSMQGIFDGLEIPVGPKDPLLGPSPVEGPDRLFDRRQPLDALIDVLVPLTPEHPVAGEVVVAALPATRRAGSKPLAIEGLPLGSTQWETPIAARQYVAFQAGVQLANRTGPLNEIEYSEFATKVRAFADAVNAEPEFPEMLHEVARARELDGFASAHDAQLTFILRARAVAWSPGYVQQTAALQGFVPGALPGRLVLPSRVSGAPPMLSLSFDAQAALADDPDQTAIREVALALDVAQIPREEQPFARLCAAALTLAPAMDGVITDDAGHPLGEAEMTVIAAELDKLYDTLAARDFAAGSVLARRLFS